MSCDRCRAGALSEFEGGGFWHCSPCRYDECVACFAASGSHGPPELAPRGPFDAWVFPRGVWGSSGAVVAPPSSIHTLLGELNAQAAVYMKRTMQSEAAPDVLVGSGEEDREYTAVLGLSADISVAKGHADAGVQRWADSCRSVADAMGEALEDEDDEPERLAAALALWRALARRSISSSCSVCFSSSGSSSGDSSSSAGPQRPNRVRVHLRLGQRRPSGPRGVAEVP